MDEYKFSLWHSPFGWIGLAASARGMVAVTSPRASRREALDSLRQMLGRRGLEGENEFIRTTRAELVRYFNRDPQADLGCVPLDMGCGTELQRQVWQLLREIPCGETRTYGELARAIGRPRAARAVGQCNARNPWAIVVPCHRVLGANAQLTGYAGGLEMKRRLLELEGIDVTAPSAMRLTAARQRRGRDAHRN
jgi:methylated-DNA-[protein]-cysteine S-methyltransferase